MSFVMTGCDGSLGSPNPALFSAVTLNSYSTPSLRPCTLKRKSGTVLLQALTHLIPLLSFLSTQYPLMSLPPSCAGLFHEMVTAFLLTLSISGVEGGPGGPSDITFYRVLWLYRNQYSFYYHMKITFHVLFHAFQTYGNGQSF